jgi:hypothetical protein
MVKVKKRWERDKKIGVGAFGRVWLEVVREGELVVSERAVKELGKDHLQACGIDFGRELLAMAKLSKVQDQLDLILLDIGVCWLLS